ncbi:uncharacterized protein EDB93DRAFT_526110 [Suillus bovinus]|uniref:uncharacterized protein n=1 Tax=Suillus bovinus TaxID=48563 RepID=UPI001B876B11|nr:uncharacterized protein EDB93DRAFT_526110 [Suillus bovinus]KAG2144643.1 hypothetical protein EDB93DRAFT_526110 [Suillus bovinus]
MPSIVHVGPNATDKSSLKPVMPPRLERLANMKRKRGSSSYESSDSGLPSGKKPPRKTGSRSDASRLMIKSRPSKRQTPITVDDESDDGNAPDDKQEEKESSSSKPNEAVSDRPRLYIRIRLPKRPTDTAKDDHSNDRKLQKKEEDDDNYLEDSSPESSEDEYVPPRKRQRRRIQAISNRSSSRAQRTSTSASAVKHDKGVQTM